MPCNVGLTAGKVDRRPTLAYLWVRIDPVLMTTNTYGPRREPKADLHVSNFIRNGRTVGTNVLEKIGKVSNPLTIIAIFAAAVEVSGSTVLPFIRPGNQYIFLWFLMTFPFTLVLLFFGVLIFKNKALYAPSDWKDEANFFREFSKTRDIERKNRDETEDSDHDFENPKSQDADLVEHLLEPLTSKITKTSSNTGKPTIDRVLKVLEERYGTMAPEKEVIFSDVKRNAIDGIIFYVGRYWIVEIKAVFSMDQVYRIAGRAATQYLSITKDNKDFKGKDFGLMLVFLGDVLSEDERKEYTTRLNVLLNETGVFCNLVVFLNTKEIMASS